MGIRMMHVPFSILFLFFLNVLLTIVSGSMLRAHDEEGDLSPSLPRSRQLKTTLKTSSLDKRVALLQVHFEGNVGDQMETIPLLKRLHDWGVHVDCFLSLWMPPEMRLNEEVRERVSEYVDHIYEEGIAYNSNIQSRNYDLLIVTPGPTVNELGHCIGRSKLDPSPRPENISMAWFGVSVTGWAQYTYERGQKYCIKMLAAREEVSLKRAKEMIDDNLDEMQLMMSGDISFSYPYSPDDPAIKDYQRTFLANLPFSDEVLNNKEWCMIFSRENNFGHNMGVHVRGKKVHIRTVDEQMIEYDIDRVVFASSSTLEDREHMSMLRHKHRVHRARCVTANTVEEMFALVSAAPHVITDRYHPGVASMIVGTKLSLTYYKSEATKMEGLHAMQKYSHDEIKAMNEKAFDALYKLLKSEKRDKSLDPQIEPPYRTKPKKKAG